MAPSSKFHVGGSHSSKFDACDAAVLCHAPPLTIISPNAHFIPQPFIYGNEPLQMCADGWFSCIDIYQWPQLFSEDYPWSITIPHWTPCKWVNKYPGLWSPPTYADFQPLPNSPFAVRFLDSAQMTVLKGLCDLTKVWFGQYKKAIGDKHWQDQSLLVMQNVQSTYNHLQHFPLTWHDIVTSIATFQRSVMECLAYLDYYKIIIPCLQNLVWLYLEHNQFWMGTFTESAYLAEQLFHA
ncbi:hypothetical protein ID866_13024, partial [Astraeus odoratus]